MMSLTDIQQAFVRRYMNGEEYVLGVRIHEMDGDNVILVDIAENAYVELPDEFLTLRVVVRTAERAVLAYR